MNRVKLLYSTIGIVCLLFGVYGLQTKESLGKDDFQNTEFTSFYEAKKALYALSLERSTFYCSCPYNEDNTVSHEPCGYKTWKYKKRALRVEVEHIVPASHLCGNLKEWKEGDPQCISKGKPYKGRKCAERFNSECKKAISDLHNLRPAVGEINAARSNFPFGEISGEFRKFGKCDFEVENHIAEPAMHLRGNIARVYLFMHYAYPGLDLLSRDEVKKFLLWSKEDPVDKKECQRNREIFKVQKTFNPFIQKGCGDF